MVRHPDCPTLFYALRRLVADDLARCSPASSPPFDGVEPCGRARHGGRELLILDPPSSGQCQEIGPSWAVEPRRDGVAQESIRRALTRERFKAGE